MIRHAVPRRMRRWLKNRWPFRQEKPGLPEGLDPRRLAETCAEAFGFTPLRTSWQQLSSWKRTGSYRLFLHPARGRPARLIYKDAGYSLEEIPALDGLPLRPGPPEYLIYSVSPVEMAGYLPRIYRAEEVEPGRRYRYLMEDLSASCRTAWSPESLPDHAEKLPALHRALQAWQSRAPACDGLIRYEAELSLSLQPYIGGNLERYARWSGDPQAAELLRLWPRMAELHRHHAGEVFDRPVPIHGDFNVSNLWTDAGGVLRVVDWEWLGFGLPCQDLVALLKTASAELEREALRRYFESLEKRELSADPMRAYAWCKLERALLDAAYMAAQALGARWKTRAHIPLYMQSSCRRGRAALEMLDGL